MKIVGYGHWILTKQKIKCAECFLVVCMSSFINQVCLGKDDNSVCRERTLKICRKMHVFGLP